MAREKLGLNQKGLARLMGVSMSTVYRWEQHGRVHPIYLLKMEHLVEREQHAAPAR